MSAVISISTGKAYGVSRMCRAWSLSRASVYRDLQPARTEAAPPRRPGPQGPMSDADLVGEIRQVITNSRFHGEGYRKVWARLRYKGIRTSKVRVLRLMRETGLCAKPCQGRHTGQGLMTEPSSRATLTKGQGMWGTDMTATLLSTGRQVAVLVAVDHCSAGCVGIHAAIRGTRFEALQPIRQGVRDCFGACATDVAAGLTIRHDNGSQYISATTSRARSPGWARNPHRPLSERPRAMAVPSASSGHSRKISSGSRHSTPWRNCKQPSRSSRSLKNLFIPICQNPNAIPLLIWIIHIECP